MRQQNTDCFETFPRREYILSFINEVRNYLFPGYFSKLSSDIDSYRKKEINKIKKLYKKHVCSSTGDMFISSLDQLEKELKQDLDFYMESDPAIESMDEVIITYPGFLAILYYRIAHIISSFAVPYVPRIITEIAHSKTGIDIHPNAKIGSPFFIDHGTGIVIGETSEIGQYVKIYHGVTLGALSLSGGAKLKGTKRHPTIKNHVTIYSGASILGGQTVIEDGVTIGSNVFIVNSVLKDSTIIYSADKIKVVK